MSGFNNDNSGVVFNEENKRNPNAPDWTGYATVLGDMGGRTVLLAGWDRRTGENKKMISLKFELPRNGGDPDHQCSANAGLLFTEKTKTNPKAPDYKGAVHIAPEFTGRKVRVAAWHNRESGEFRLAIDELRQRQDA